MKLATTTKNMRCLRVGWRGAGTRRFRFKWAYRAASNGRLISGFPQKAIGQFSSYRTQITKTRLALANQYEHAPGQRVLASIGRFANAMTHRAKGPGALDFTALLRGWKRSRTWPSLRRCATSREPSGVGHPTQQHRQGGAETRAPNSPACLRGSRDAANSRTRKNVRAWQPVSCGARVASRPLLRSVRTSGNYRRGYTRTRLEARWAIRLGR